MRCTAEPVTCKLRCCGLVRTRSHVLAAVWTAITMANEGASNASTQINNLCRTLKALSPVSGVERQRPGARGYFSAGARLRSRCGAAVVVPRRPNTGARACRELDPGYVRR
ncbi:MAG: hypothetical protein Tsb0020_24040 [Haliangiales bacterium]